MRKPHTLNAAETSRESFSKAIYDRLFTWIVGHVNSAIDPALTGKIRKNTVIGVLDIYGFEVFDNNSFEQFCINYCNERLQQLFIELVLKQQVRPCSFIQYRFYPDLSRKNEDKILIKS